MPISIGNHIHISERNCVFPVSWMFTEVGLLMGLSEYQMALVGPVGGNDAKQHKSQNESFLNCMEKGWKFIMFSTTKLILPPDRNLN